MAWTGDVMRLVQEIMNERPLDDVITTVYHRNPVYARVMKTARKEDYYGSKAKLTVHTQIPMNAMARPEATDVPLPGADEFTNVFLTIKQYMASIGWTEEEAEEAVTTNDAAVVDLVERKRNNAMIDMQVKLNTAFSGDGTGRLARVASYDSGGKAVTVDNTMADFGIADVSRIYKGMYVDIYTVPDITGSDAWTPKARKVQVTSVDKAAKTFTIAPMTDINGGAVSGSDIDASPADSDFVFTHGAVGLTSASKFSHWNEAMGLLGIVDDGGSVGHEFDDGTGGYNGCWLGSTFQSVTRANVSLFNSLVRKASDWAGGTDGVATTCDLSVVNECIRMIDEEGGGGGEVTALYMNPKTRDWMAALATATNNAFVNADSGKIVPGMYIESYRSSLGRILPIIPMTSIPDGVIMGGDERDLILFEPVPVGWKSNSAGQIAFEAPGTRNLTNEAWLRTKVQLAAKRCDNWFKLEDIDTNS